MINPENNIRHTDPKGIEKAHGSLDRTKLEKTKRRTDGVFERKKSQEELAKEWEDVRQEAEKGAGKTKEAPPERNTLSLFDLARSKPQPMSTEGKLDQIAQEVEVAESEGGHKGSLFELASQTHSKTEFKEKVPVENHTYIREAPDLSEVNLLAVPAPEKSDMITPMAAVAPPPDANRIKKIIDEIVKHLYQLEKSGETSVIIVINDPKSPLHKTSIRIQEFDSAKGELNVTIDNLRPDAKVLVENQKALLLESLEQKGYQVQQFIATTSLENPRFDFSTSRQDARGGREEKGQEGEAGKEQEKEPQE